MKEVVVGTPQIRLDSFLKWVGAVGTGGQAKVVITSGQVRVNGVPETRRSRKLVPGDEVVVWGTGEWRMTDNQEGDYCAPGEPLPD